MEIKQLTIDDMGSIEAVIRSNNKYFLVPKPDSFTTGMITRARNRLTDNTGSYIFGAFNDSNELIAFVRGWRFPDQNRWCITHFTTKTNAEVFTKKYGSKTADVIFDIINFIVPIMENESRKFFYTLVSTDYNWENIYNNPKCLLSKYYWMPIALYKKGDTITKENGITYLYNGVVITEVQVLQYAKESPVKLESLPEAVFEGNRSTDNLPPPMSSIKFVPLPTPIFTANT